MCTASCTAIWQPLTVSSNATTPSGLGTDIGMVKRPDGGQQVTFKGMPLYSFTEEGPGQVTGDGFKDTFDGTSFTWHAALASGSAASSSPASSAPSPSPSY